jgi:hypothetical protein
MASSLVSVTYQAPLVVAQPPQPQHYHHCQPSIPPPAPLPVFMPVPTDSKTEFFSGKYNTWAQGCAFCGHLGHHINACPGAEEYVDTGRVQIVNCHLYLPTGKTIPNDGRGLRIKAGVDAWLTANPQYSATLTASTRQCDPPPQRLKLGAPRHRSRPNLHHIPSCRLAIVRIACMICIRISDEWLW